MQALQAGGIGKAEGFADGARTNHRQAALAAATQDSRIRDAAKNVRIEVVHVPDSLEQNVAGCIHLHGLFAGAGRILVAVSGGADSTALLHVLRSLRTDGSISAELVCAHVNHRLRGQASAEDERFVVEQAARLELLVVTRAVDVRAYATASRLSIETAARRLRLESLREIATTCGCAWVATGHQKNDNAETVLQRLRRGTGFRGLAGIWPVRQFDGLWFARPLLDVTREEIVAYLNRRQLAWREDRTNLDPTYTRNYIRHKLLPALQQEAHRSLVEELAELATSARGLYDRVQRDAREAMSQLARTREGEIAFVASPLASLPELVAVELVRQALVTLGCGERDLTRDHYREILRLARSIATKEVLALPGGFTARRACEEVLLSGPAPQPRRVGLAPPLSSIMLRIPGRTRFAGWRIEARVLNAAELNLGQVKGGKSPFCEYFDLDRVKEPVVVRPRRAGDRFRPLGMDHEKRLGKFLTTAKVSQDLRQRIVVVADQEKIIWVCPIRIGESAKVTPETRHILMLTVAYEESPNHAS
jgi:tRNA(Ile)-lysidine synthase